VEEEAEAEAIDVLLAIELEFDKNEDMELS
jgi:hypothetical protein